MSRGCIMLAVVAAWAAGVAATAAPVVFQTGPGRFEVNAPEMSGAREATAAADDAWRLLAVPLGLPEAFPSRIILRLVAAGEWRETGAFRAEVEPGGVVSVRVRADAGNEALRRALVQGLLLRLAVMQQGATERLTVPLWLEQGLLGWWRTRAEPAALDALRQETAALDPPAVEEVLSWPRGDAGTRARTAGAEWLLVWLQSETTGVGEWPAMRRRLLAGAEPLAALAESYPGRFANAVERELWWQTGWHHVRSARTLPTLEAAESRRELESLQRFTVEAGEGDALLPLAGLLAHAAEPYGQAELERRRVWLNHVLPALHPFYRNAGLSLAEVFGAARLTAAARAARLAAFERDWRDATELEAATGAALDALERRRGG